MKVRDLMTQDVRTCRPDSPLTEVASMMAEVDCGCVPVVDGQRLAGVITDRDIVLRAVAKGRDARSTRAEDCMTSPPITCTPDTDVHQAADLMAEKQVRRLCCVDGDRLVGIISLGDLATVPIHENEAGEALSEISEPSRPSMH